MAAAHQHIAPDPRIIRGRPLEQSNRGRAQRISERILIVLGVCLPVPLLAMTGLSIPLPATVERLAASLVPWASAAPLHSTEAPAAAQDTILPTSGERVVLAARASATRALPTTDARLPRPVKRGSHRRSGGGVAVTRDSAVVRPGALATAISADASGDAVPGGSTHVATSESPATVVPAEAPATLVSAEAPTTPASPEPTKAARAKASTPSTGPERKESPPARVAAPQPSAPSTDPERREPRPTIPDSPAPSPKSEQPNVVERTTDTVKAAVQPVTDSVEPAVTEVAEKSKKTAGGLVDGVGG